MPVLVRYSPGGTLLFQGCEIVVAVSGQGSGVAVGRQSPGDFPAFRQDTCC